MLDFETEMIAKLCYCEKATKFEKKSSNYFDVSLVTSKQIGRVYQNVVDLSEDLSIHKEV